MSREEPKREDPERRAKVLLVTEGTYPFIVGGVSTWCDILINGLPAVDWSVLPITAGGVATIFVSGATCTTCEGATGLVSA